MKTTRHILVAVAAGMLTVLLGSCQKEERIRPANALDATSKNSTTQQSVDRSALSEATDQTARWDDAGVAITKGRLVGTWKLISLYGQSVDVHTGEIPWLYISDQLAGFGGCNQLSGSVVQLNDQISFPDLGATKMYCVATHDLEVQFLTALRATDSFYQVDGDVYFNDNKSVVAILRRVSYQPASILNETFQD